MEQREIKFRAWDGEQMIYPPDGYMFHSTVLSTNNPGGISVAAFPRSKKILLMQYTGLKDKNGKEIYEGDIARHSHWSTSNGLSPLGNSGWKEGEVYFDKGRFVVRGNETWNTLEYINLEVIGNIHEHPELISKQLT